MNYTDQEILDLEEALETVGHAKQVTLALVEPDGWNEQKLDSFGSFMEKTHGGELVEAGLTTGASTFLFSLFPGGTKSIIKIMGPAIRARKALNELYDKYNCSRTLDLSE
jgi:hypothetical protein